MQLDTRGKGGVFCFVLGWIWEGGEEVLLYD